MKRGSSSALGIKAQTNHLTSEMFLEVDCSLLRKKKRGWGGALLRKLGRDVIAGAAGTGQGLH